MQLFDTGKLILFPKNCKTTDMNTDENKNLPEKKFGERLKTLIKDAGFRNQQHFLEELKSEGLKIQRTTVSKWCNGYNKPRKHTIYPLLAKLLNTTPEYLEFGHEEKNSHNFQANQNKTIQKLEDKIDELFKTIKEQNQIILDSQKLISELTTKNLALSDKLEKQYEKKSISQSNQSSQKKQKINHQRA